MDVKTVVMTIVSVTIGVMLVGSLLVPTAADVMKELNEKYTDEPWGTLIGVVVVCVIMSLIVVALYAYK